jgi:hypothetical protein
MMVSKWRIKLADGKVYAKADFEALREPAMSPACRRTSSC